MHVHLIMGTVDALRTYLTGYVAMEASISSIVLGMSRDRFSQPSSVTRQLSSKRKPIPQSSQ